MGRVGWPGRAGGGAVGAAAFELGELAESVARLDRELALPLVDATGDRPPAA